MKKMCCFVVVSAILVVFNGFSAGVADETGLIPTLNLSFNAAASDGSYVNFNTGSGTLTFSDERTSGAPYYVEAPNGMALNLNAGGSSPYGNLTDVIPAATDYTVAFFAKLSGAANGLIFHLRDSDGGLVFRRGANAGEVVVAANSSLTAISLTGLSDLETKWHFYAITVTVNSIKLYIDGVLRGESAAGVTSRASKKENYQFGSRHAGMKTGEAKYGGLLDDFRVYTQVLTADQLFAVNKALVQSRKTISVSFATNSNSSALPVVDTLVGLAPAPASSWNNLSDATQANAVILSGETCATPAQITWSSSTMWGQGNTSSLEATVLRNYLDDGGSGASITVSNIPFSAYEVIIYQATDSDSLPFRPASVNAQFYTWDAAASRVIKGDARYGNVATSRTAFTLGVNALRIRRSFVDPADGEFTGTLTIKGQAGSSGRGCIAAIQIVAIDPDEAIYTRTLAANGDWGDSLWNTASASGVAWADGATAVLNGSADATLALDAPVLAAGLIVQGKGALAVTGDSLTLGGALNTTSFAAADSIAIVSPLVNENLTVWAHNPNAAAAGKVALSGANAFQTLTLRSGTLDAALGAANLVLDGGSLSIPAGSHKPAISIIRPTVFRVDSGEAAFTGPVVSTNVITKTGAGNLTFENNLTSTAALTVSAGQVTLKGATNTLVDYPANTVFATGTTTRLTTDRVTIATETRTWPMAPGATIETTAFRAANSSGSTSVINHTNGTFRVIGNISTTDTVPTFLLGYWTNGGTGTYNLSGGTLSVPNAEIRLAHQGTGTLNISENGVVETLGFNNCDNTGTIAMSGGRLIIKGSGGIGIRATKIFPKFSGGTLEATGSFAVNSSIELLEGTGPVIEPNAHTITINQPFNGEGRVILGSAATTGSIVFNANPVHTGGTVLAGGVLDASGKSVAFGALEIQGSPAVKVSAGVLPDYSDTTFCTPATLTFAEGASLKVLIDAGGNDTLLSSYAFFDACEGIDASKITAEIINKGSAFPEEASAAVEAGENGTVRFILSGVVAPKNLFWNGSLSSRWSTNPADTPWGAGAVDGVTSAFTDIDSVNFTDVERTAQSVTIAGAVTPAAVYVDNSATAYSLTSDATTPGSVTLASAPFVKKGSARFTFDIPVSFADTLTVEAGELQMTKLFGTLAGDGLSATYAKAMSIARNAQLSFESSAGTQILGSDSASVTNNGTFEIGGSGNLTIAGAIIGSGTLNKTGAGTFSMSKVNPNFTGEIHISGGILRPTATGANGSFAAAKVFVEEGGTLVFDITDISGYAVNDNPITIEAGGELRILARDTLRRGIVLNGGLLTVANADSGRALDLFDGPRIASTGDARIEGVVSGAVVDPKIRLRQQNTANPVQEVNVEGTLTIAATLESSNTNTATTLKKTGSGTLIMAGKTVEGAATGHNGRYPFTYTGPTVVSAGTLMLTVQHNNASGTYQINSGTTLTGTGIVAGAGAVTVAGQIDTGLTINTLALAESGIIRVIPGSVLRVTGGFSAATAITLDISAFTPDTPAQYVLELPAGAAIPQEPCVLQGANASLYRATWVGTRLKIGQPSGVMIKVL